MSAASQVRKPRLAVIGTGGTIAGTGASSANTGAYQSAVVAVDTILEAVPAVFDVAEIAGEQIFQIDSSDLTDALLLQLARRVSALVKSDDVDGVVILHGTDTLEETACFLNLVVHTTKPVVVLGAMRPGTALSADGPLNLYHAVVVAASPAAAGKGVLVVMNDEIHTGRDIAKTNSFKLDAFASPHGPLGYVAESRPVFYRLPARAHTVDSAFNIDTIEALPAVGIVYAHAGMGREVYDALVASGARAIVHAGFGGGNVPGYLADALREIRAQGVFIVRATRTGSGIVIRNGAVDDDANDWIAVDDQNPQKARLLMALALTLTSDSREIQEMFWRY